MTLEELQTKHLELQDSYKELETNYNSLKTKHDTDLETIDKLNQDVESLKETNMQLFLRVTQPTDNIDTKNDTKEPSKGATPREKLDDLLNNF